MIFRVIRRLLLISYR